MASTGNAFAALERLGGLEAFAGPGEILNRLRAGENEGEERQKAAVQLPRTFPSKLGRFSDAEVEAFQREGWTIVASRARKRPAGESIGDTEAVIPRALPTGVHPRQDTPASLPAEKRAWKLLRWGALAVLGAMAVAKLASRR